MVQEAARIRLRVQIFNSLKTNKNIMAENEKFRISIIDFMLENGKHEVGIDKNGNKCCYGDMVEYNGEKNWFIAYRYGDTVLKQVGMWAMIVLKDLSSVEKQNVVGAGADWLIIGYTDEPFYEKVKHLL